jgi:programmed cell death 8 (apoptosis-inducing factor)
LAWLGLNQLWFLFLCRSDLGPEIGYEAVGLVDASLTTVGVWARASAADTPSATELDPSDIRAQPLGQTSISTTDPERERAFGVGKEAGTTTITTFPTGMSSISTHVSASSVPSFGKGVVFYAREGRIVGVLLFNLFNRVSLARDVLAQGRTVDDIAQLRQLFNIYEAV